MCTLQQLLKSQKRAFLSITLEWFKDVVDRYYNYLMVSANIRTYIHTYGDTVIFVNNYVHMYECATYKFTELMQYLKITLYICT